MDKSDVLKFNVLTVNPITPTAIQRTDLQKTGTIVFIMQKKNIVMLFCRFSYLMHSVN